ncbi:hypothetical protein [Vibrio quintilis]|nr:hypothetical protein [Vibrio quintilis]
MKSWAKGSFPRQDGKRAILNIFAQICETEEITRAWCDKYRELELKNKKQQANSRQQRQRTNKSGEVDEKSKTSENIDTDKSAITDSMDTSAAEPADCNPVQLYNWCLTHPLHLLTVLLVFLICIALLVFGFSGGDKSLIINNNIHLDNQQNKTLNMEQGNSGSYQNHSVSGQPGLQPQKAVFSAYQPVAPLPVSQTPSSVSPSAPAFPPVAAESQISAASEHLLNNHASAKVSDSSGTVVTSKTGNKTEKKSEAEKVHAAPDRSKNKSQADQDDSELTSYVDLKPGLNLDVYVFKGKNKDLIFSFDKYQVGSLTYKKGGLFTYADHLINPGVYKAASGRDSGLYYHGYIFFPSPDTYVFSLDFNSGEPGVMQVTKKCRVTLNLNHKEKLNGTVRLLLSEHGKGVFTMPVHGGLNDFSLWFSCNKLVNVPLLWNVTHIYQKTTVTVRVRKLSESKASLLSAGQLFHSL